MADMEEVGLQAHSLKGSSAMVGARSMMQLCADVHEAATSAESAPRIVAAIAALSAELRSMSAAAETDSDDSQHQLNT